MTCNCKATGHDEGCVFRTMIPPHRRPDESEFTAEPSTIEKYQKVLDLMAEIAQLRAEVDRLKSDREQDIKTIQSVHEQRDHWQAEAEKLYAEVEAMTQARDIIDREASRLHALLERSDLQVADLTEERNALKESLKDVLEISEVEGAANLTTMESCKLMAARSLLGPESRFSVKQLGDGQRGHECDPSCPPYDPPEDRP